MMAQEQKSFIARLFSYRESAILLALILLMTAVTIFAPNFINGSNLYLVSKQISFVAIVAFGELFVILTGGIDLSVGSNMELSGVIRNGLVLMRVSAYWQTAVTGVIIVLAAVLDRIKNK
jgi:ribose transport system permease protein